MVHSSYMGPDKLLHYQPNRTGRSREIYLPFWDCGVGKDGAFECSLFAEYYEIWVANVWFYEVKGHIIAQGQSFFNQRRIIPSKCFKGILTTKFSNGQISPKSVLIDQNFKPNYLQNSFSDWPDRHSPKKLLKSSIGKYMGIGGLIVPERLVNRR
jgi:hypothetical protein